MLEARRLLIRTDTTVEAVARQLSFSESLNFTKFFQRLTGENPKSWRNRRVVTSHADTMPPRQSAPGEARAVRYVEHDDR